MSAGTMVAALLYDPLKIWTGLFFFIIGLFAIPVLFSKVKEAAVTITALTVYIFYELSNYFFPSALQLRRNFQAELNPEGERPVDPHPRHEDDNLNRMLIIIGDLIFHPNRIAGMVREDLNIRTSPSEDIIRYKFKALFLLLSATASALILFVPPISALVGATSLCNFLVASGIKYIIAEYAKVIIYGGLIYSLRAPVVGLMVALSYAIQSISQRVRQYWRPPREDQEENRPLISSRQNTRHIQHGLSISGRDEHDVALPGSFPLFNSTTSIPSPSGRRWRVAPDEGGDVARACTKKIKTR